MGTDIHVNGLEEPDFPPTDWYKFIGEPCPVCKQKILLKNWLEEPYYCSSGYLRKANYKPNSHAKYILLMTNGKNHKYYPVHKECSLSLIQYQS